MEPYKAFRLQGIPGGSNEERVKELVRSALECSDDVGISVRSLADDPYIDGDMMATLDFLKIPEMLSQGSRETKVGDLVFDSHFFDFTTLHTPTKGECTIDIVAVSGLNGHPLGSFKQRGENWIWLRDALVRDLPSSRVLTFGLDTQLINSQSFQNIADLAGKLRTALGIIRKEPKRPLVLIGHSLGGIIVKEAVNLMAKSRVRNDQASFHAIAGIMFFGVPNQGMAIKSLVPMVENAPNRALLESLGPNSLALRTQGQAFLEILDSNVAFHVVNFYETKMSQTAVRDETTQRWTVSGPLEILVEPHSATHGRVFDTEKHHVHAVDYSHGDLVKFSSRRDGTYRVVVDHLKRMQDFEPRDMKSPEVEQWEKDCLHSLAFAEQHVREAQLKPAPDTCQWLLNHKPFTSWLHEPRGLLWIRGKPGSGKSMAMKKLLRYIQSAAANLDTCLVSFFIHGRGGPLQKTPLGLYRSLLYQISQSFPDVLVHLTETFKKKTEASGKVDEKWVWTPEDILEHLTRGLDLASRHRSITILVDALDEAGQTEAYAIANAFKTLLATVDRYAPIRICFSCRHYPEITLDGGHTIVIEDHNADDIDNVIHKGLSETNFSQTEQHMLQEKVLTGSKGIFQWSSLVLENMIRSRLSGCSFKESLELVQEVPEGLDNLYSSLLFPKETEESSSKTRSERDLREKKLTLKLFQWVLFAIRPLRPNELQHALALDWRMDQKSIAEYRNGHEFIREEHLALRIKHLSKGLVDISGSFSSGQVQFIHQSVPDFLLGSETTLQKLSVDSTPSMTWLSHFHLSRSCVEFLSMDEVRKVLKEEFKGNQVEDDKNSEFDDQRWFEATRTNLQKHERHPLMLRRLEELPFLVYAWQNWLFHAESAQRQQDFEIPDEFARHDPLHSVPWGIKLHQQPLDRNLDAILGGPTQSWFRTLHADSISKGASSIFTSYYLHGSLYHGTPPMMHLFACCGLVSCVQNLAKVKPALLREKDHAGYTPLAHAIWGQQKVAVSVLLQLRVDVNAFSEKSEGSPLILACEWGDLEVVSCMIKAGANVNFPGRYDTPLSSAVYAGHGDVVDLLIKARARSNMRSKHGDTPLHALACSKTPRPDIFETLIHHGASIKLRDSFLNTPLHLSASNSPTPIFKAFLEEALKFEKTNAKSKLSKRYHEDFCIVNWRDHRGQTPIFHALRRKDPERLKLLHDAGADLQLAGPNGVTPFLSAFVLANNEAIRFFLEAGVDVDKVDRYGNTALLLDSFSEDDIDMDTLRLLIQAGINVNARNRRGVSAIMRAARDWNHLVVGLLLEYGAEVNAQDKEGKTPLLYAVNTWKWERPGIDMGFRTIKRLLDSGANIHAIDHSGRNALFYARGKLRQPIFRLLREAGLREMLGESSESKPEEGNDAPPPLPKGKTQRMKGVARKFAASIGWRRAV